MRTEIKLKYYNYYNKLLNGNWKNNKMTKAHNY